MVLLGIVLLVWDFEALPSAFWSAFWSLLVTLKNLFRKPTTDRHFPKIVRSRADRYRTSFALVHDEHGEEACIACKKCQIICPSFIITHRPCLLTPEDVVMKP